MSRRGGQRKGAKEGAFMFSALTDAGMQPPSSPLAAFWDLLDLRAKASILQVKLQALKSIHLCPNCKRLLKAAWTPNTGDLNTVHDAYDIPWGYTLMRLQDGSYVTDDTRTSLSPQKVLEFAITPYPDLQAERCFQYRGPYDGEVFRYVSRIPDVPANACWYCHDKIYVRFVDMLTYPRPPRRFTMLLCKDDRVRALKQVLAAEVGLESPGRLVLQVLGKPLDDDNASMQSLGIANGQLVVITKRPTIRPETALVGVSAIEADGSAAFSSSSDESSEESEEDTRSVEPIVGVDDSATSTVHLLCDAPSVPGAANLHRYDAEGSADEAPSPAVSPAAATVAMDLAASHALVAVAKKSRIDKKTKNLHLPGPLSSTMIAAFDTDPFISVEGSVQQNKRFVAELLLGATGYNSRGGGGGRQDRGAGSSGGVGDKFAGLPTNESPPVSPRGPVASVDRRHGYSVLGCMLSHLLHTGISAAWDADVSALRAQEELIAECESERQVRVYV
jgi:hypothetical protein